MSDKVAEDYYDLIKLIVPILREKTGPEVSMSSARSFASGKSSGRRSASRKSEKSQNRS